jgi:hypothetical protein
MPLAVVGAAWVHLAARGNRTLRTGILAATLGLLSISLPFTWQAMKTYPYQFEESAFARALETGDSQEGTKSVGGYRVGFGAEKEMADYIHTHVSGRDAILTDDAIAFPVMLLDGRPGVYLDRIDAGDAFWLDIANAPWGRVRYVLVAPIVHEDLVLVRYPELAHGSYGAFRLVHRNARWALFSVAEQR